MWPAALSRSVQISPSKVDWLSLLPNKETDDELHLDDTDFQGGLLRDHLDAMKAIDDEMCAIYLMAKKESEKYFQLYHQFLGTDFSTNMRPLVRWRLGRPVEMSWVTKVVTKKLATPADLRQFTTRGKAVNGVLNRIVYQNNQPYRVREVFKYIPRGKSLFYSAKIFAREAGWVQDEGVRLERCFYHLRKIMTIKMEYRRKLASLCTLERKFFEDSVFGSHTFDEYKQPKEYLNYESEVSADEALLNEEDN